jgi:hypothetical protein
METIEMTAGSIAPANTEPQDLEMLASSIRAGLNTINGYMQSALRVALQVGEDLLKAQAQVAKGQWEQWLQKNCSLRESTARLYKQLAKNRATVEAGLNTDPSLSVRAALRLIATPKQGNAVAAPTGRSANAVSVSGSSRLDILTHWERSTPFEQKAVLAAMKRDRLLAILPDGIGVVPAPVEPKNGSVAIPLPNGDDGLGIPAFLDRRIKPSALPALSREGAAV